MPVAGPRPSRILQLRAVCTNNVCSSGLRITPILNIQDRAADAAERRSSDRSAKSRQEGVILIHSNTSPTKRFRPRDLVSVTKNDPLGANRKPKPGKYKRELAHLRTALRYVRSRENFPST